MICIILSDMAAEARRSGLKKRVSKVAGFLLSAVIVLGTFLGIVSADPGAAGGTDCGSGRKPARNAGMPDVFHPLFPQRRH